MKAFDGVVSSGLIVANGNSRWTDSGLVNPLFLDVPDELLHQRLIRRLGTSHPQSQASPRRPATVEVKEGT